MESACVCVYAPVCVLSTMSGDSGTLSWKSTSSATSRSNSLEGSPVGSGPPHRDGGLAPLTPKIVKVCFFGQGSNLGSNFKLVRCEEGWTIRVNNLKCGVCGDDYSKFKVSHPNDDPYFRSLRTLEY